MPPLVLVHAFPLPSAMWREVAERLRDRFAVLTPDLPGFCDAPPSPGWTVDTAADALADTLAASGHATAVVGGNSMGGYVALAFARRHPERLAGLILIDTRAEADTPEARTGRDTNIELVAESGVAALVEKTLPRLLGKTTHATRPDLVRRVRELASAQSPSAVSAALAALRDWPDATPDLPHIRVPTLVIVGAEDELTPPTVAAGLVAATVGAELVTLPECGHLSPLEAPDAVAAAIERRFG